MKKINIIDLAIFTAITIALVVGFFTYKHYRQTAGNQIQSTSKIMFQVYLRSVTLTGPENPIKTGERTFITIRNVPYTELPIIESKIELKKAVIPNPEKKPSFLLVDDFSQMFMYDIIVTVTDMAKITNDGAVVGGNKIKIGMPITLEGQAYKLNGTVSDIRIIIEKPKQALTDKDKKPANEPVKNAK